MAEAADLDAKIREFFWSEVTKLEEECVRPNQVNAIRCSANCCEDKNSPLEVVQWCLIECMLPAMIVESELSEEVHHFQDTLTSCAQQCQDEYKDKIPNNASPADIEKAKNHAEKCQVKCCATNSHLIPNLIAKYRDLMER